MPKVQNLFVNGRMDSDTNYSIIDNKSYILAENIRIVGEGDDGAPKNLKGSKLVSAKYNEDGMQIVGGGNGNNNNVFFFLAHQNGKSKLVEYNTITEESRLIVQDSTVLRFDLVRWNNGNLIIPYKYILSINQIGDMLHFSNENWKYPRVINLKRLNDYASGFTEEDISLIKKPPLLAPVITSRTASATIDYSEKQNKFISFAYRFKYSDGVYSPLSFYTDSVFEPKSDFEIDEDRYNMAMVNKYDTVTLSVKSGNKNVTDVEVYAREHGSNTAYLIYSVNKEKSNINNNVDIANITYKYSTNYTVLDEENTKLLYSNIPNFPKSQTAAGNRLVYLNYKEGNDLIDKNGENINVDYRVTKNSNNYINGANNKTIISQIKNKIGIVYLDDYNTSTTILLPTDQSSAEFEFDYASRNKVNSISVNLLNKPPKWATKIKFLIKSDLLSYENFFSTILRKTANKLYIKLEDGNVNKLKEGDTIYPISEGSNYNEFTIKEIKEFKKNDGFVSEDGTYAVIKVEDKINLTKNTGEDIHIKFDNIRDIRNNIIDYSEDLSNNPKRFYDPKHNFVINNSDYGILKAGDSIKLSLYYKYGQCDTSSVNNQGYKEFTFDSKISLFFDFFVDNDYSDISKFLAKKFSDYRFDTEVTSSGIILKPNIEYSKYIEDVYSSLYLWRGYRKFEGLSERNWNLAVNKIYNVDVNKGFKPINFRTLNKESLNEFYYETPKTYLINNGNYLADRYDNNGNPIFDVDFYNGFTWGNGVESYKVKDGFNQKELKFNFRGSLNDPKGYKQIHRKNDVTYSGLYNYELGINELGIFNPTLANWKTLPNHFGEGQRIIATKGDLSVYFTDATGIINFGKSIIMDLTGSESVGLTNDVLGDFLEVSTFGVSENPESVVQSPFGNYFTDKKRRRILLHAGREVQELNPIQSGFNKEGVDLLTEYDSFLGAYDESHGEYIIGLDNMKSVAFNLGQKGFTTYFTNAFDFIIGTDGKVFTGYNGNLYQNEVTNFYNNLAGQGQFCSLIKYVVNPELDTDKIFKAMELQSSHAWNVNIRTNLTESYIPSKHFVKKESFYTSEILRNIKGNRKSVGVGKVESITGNTLRFNYPISNSISCGDLLMVKEKNLEYEIKDIKGKELTLSNVYGITVDDICYAAKKYEGNYRPDGDHIRGKWMEVILTSNVSEESILYSVTTEVIPSNL